jgi:diadenosine tetraphosphatase ApaH/serine/threonine PP2A family protein phosphatase
LQSIEEIDSIEKPIQVSLDTTDHLEQCVLDLLWSDPCESDREIGFKPNTFRDSTNTGNIVKFGADRVMRFLHDNRLNMLIRGHECVMEGYERSSRGDMVTVFSATDYCGKNKNPAAILYI